MEAAPCGGDHPRSTVPRWMAGDDPRDERPAGSTPGVQRPTGSTPGTSARGKAYRWQALVGQGLVIAPQNLVP